jgi:hypothetical protein
MKASDIFPGKYLKAADLGTAEPIVTIERVAMEELGDETKAVVYFKDKTKGVVLNKTNWNSIVEISGEDDCDDWAGTRIKLYVAKVEYQGKRMPAIRIDAPEVSKRATGKQLATKQAFVADDDADNTPIEDEDPLPF